MNNQIKNNIIDVGTKLSKTINKSGEIANENRNRRLISLIPIYFLAILLIVLWVIGYFTNEAVIDFIMKNILGYKNESFKNQNILNKHKLYTIIICLLLFVTINNIK